MSDEKWSEELDDVTFTTNRLILLQSRQTAKCWLPATYISIKDIENSPNYS